MRGFSATNLKNMRLFYEAWRDVESKSSVATDDFANGASNTAACTQNNTENQVNTIRQLQLTNLENFPLAEFLSISFSHHISIINNTKDTEERLFYIRYCHNYKPTTEDLPKIIKKHDLYHHQGSMPNE